MQTEIQFVVPTTNTDGSPITLALTFVAFIDTVNPPVKSFAVPAADVAAAVSGTVTSKFTSLGFVPAANTDYFAEVVAIDTNGTSAPSTVFSFAYLVVPAAPTSLKVS
jgi:hypothetical protein